MTWLSENTANIIVATAVLAAIAAAVWNIVRNKRKGGESCCGNCSCCRGHS